jgi:LruC domain-containing protein
MKNLIFLLLLTAVTACRPFDLPDQEVVSNESKTLDQLTIPNAFNFNTHKDVNLTIAVKDNSGVLMPNVPVNIFIKKQDGVDSVFLLSAQTNTEGVFETVLSLDMDVETLVATTDYIGIPSYQSTALKSNNVTLTFGDDNNINSPRLFVEQRPELGQTLITRGATAFTYMGLYDASGVPKYLEAKGDVIPQDILKDINSSLPERGNVIKSGHVEFVSNTAQQNVILKENADVWVTFVHEGTSNYNALGYYTYPTANPPSTIADIQNLKVIFPNTSFVKSGGGLKSGDKVKLGNFKAGTTVAWFIMPKGWDEKTQKVYSDRSPIHFADKKLNTFTPEEYRQHAVTLLDEAHKLLLVCFEDLSRPGGDNDFNDAVFFATVTPFSAVVTTNIPKTVPPKDTDGDGVPDIQDAEPSNPLVAYYNYAPGLNQTNTLAFEDMWPLKGDYDMNDVVVDYNILEKLNAQNKIAQIKFSLNVRALGGTFHNGFGFELPITPNKVASVTGAQIKETYIKRNTNGTEVGQDKAVIIAFDNSTTLVTTPTGTYFNTDKTKPNIADFKCDITVDLATAVTRAELGTAPYNPFIIVNRDRGREVHLAGYKPTKLANNALFKTSDDDTQGNKYYQSKTNLPWAIHLATSFQYPVEKAPINKAYLKFNNWAESGGATFSDWYMKKPAYTDPAKIY